MIQPLGMGYRENDGLYPFRGKPYRENHLKHAFPTIISRQRLRHFYLKKKKQLQLQFGIDFSNFYSMSVVSRY